MTRFRGRSAARRRASLALCTLLLALGGCYTTRLDMDDLNQPVTMSESAIAHRSDASPEEAEVGSYAALRAYQSTVTPGSTKMTNVNDPQAAAFQLIGGDPRRAITGVRLHADGRGVYLVFFAHATIQVGVEGRVVELPDDGGEQ